MHPTVAGFYPFLLGSPARCTFLSYLCLYICLGSPARSQLSRSCSCPNRLRQSLRWWPPHHCSVPPLPPTTLVGLISELRRNTSSTPIPPTNLHSYHCHYQPAPCAIYRSTTRAPPCSTHIPCLRPIILHMHQFSRSWVSVATRTCEDLSQHPLAPFGVGGYMFHSTTICSPKYLLICLCLSLYKYSSLLYVFC